jgi:hypothetical protein
MSPDRERSLQRRQEAFPEKLLQGGLIVGVEQEIQGSLVSLTGAAIERITRERLEVPGQLKLPERSVYLLDPTTRRLIMISNRERVGFDKTPDKYGLFAEIVELDEEGKPSHTLSTSEVLLPNDQYQLVAVDPNKYKMPPSHVEVIDEEEQGKKKFVPWNVELAELQNWMGQVVVDPNEDLGEFVRKFDDLRDEARQQAYRRISEVFPGGDQGFDGKIKPVNLIITTQNKEDALYEASIHAGFYPFLISPDVALEVINLVDKIKYSENLEMNSLIGFFQTYNSGLANRAAVVTIDEECVWYPDGRHDDRGFAFDHSLSDKFRKITNFISQLQKQDSMFALVRMPVIDDQQNIKVGNGFYYSYGFDNYGLLLNKLKADLLLTMFLRGEAGILK